MIMKFKGNKKLSIGKDKLKVLNDNGVLIIAHINNYGNESKYDALLFSKAYEVLEKLDKIVNLLDVKCTKGCTDKSWKDFQNGDGEDVGVEIDIFIKEAKKLIKEATEL